jgi:TraY domain
MGKRGPQPKGEYGRNIPRTAVLSTRLQKDTRALLEKAARTSGRSLSQELEHRLRRTFRDDDWDIKLYGTKENAAVVNLVGATIQSASTTNSAARKHDWLKEQWLFDDVMAAIRHVLLWFRPGGDSGLRQITLGSGTARADQLIKEIRSAEPALPITKGSTREHAMAVLREKLGNLVTARNPYHDLLEPKVTERSKHFELT